MDVHVSPQWIRIVKKAAGGPITKNTHHPHFARSGNRTPINWCWKTPWVHSSKRKKKQVLVSEQPPYIEEYRWTMCLHLNSPESILIRKLPKIRLKLVSQLWTFHSFGLPENEKRFFIKRSFLYIIPLKNEYNFWIFNLGPKGPIFG